MEDKRIIYGGSKAIKVTSDMQRGLNSYVKVAEEYDNSSLELNNLEKTISEKNNELETFKVKEASEDNKEAKEANKQVKRIEKELEKLEDDATKIRINVQELETKKSKPQLEGTAFKTYAALEQKITSAKTNEPAAESPVNEEVVPIDDNIPEIPVANETDNIPPVQENESLVTNQEMPNLNNTEESINTPVTDSVIPEVPIIDNNIDSTNANATEIEKPSENENVIPEISAVENETDEPTAEDIFDTEINEEPIISEGNQELANSNNQIEETTDNSIIPEISTVSEKPEENIFDTEINEKSIDNEGTDNLSEQATEMKNVIPEISDTAKNDAEVVLENSNLDELGEDTEGTALETEEENQIETNEDNLISELEEEIIDENSEKPEDNNDDREKGDEFIFDNLTSDDLDRIWNELHKDRSGINSPKIETFNENDKFNPLVTELTSFEENTDISNLTQFNEYNDYVFAYGQNKYGKEALTPKEIDNLETNEDFLDEKTFLKQRNSQYHDINRENARIKQEITALGEEYQRNIDSMSEKYTKNVNELNETLEEAKKEINKLLNQKIQYERLNNALSETANEQGQKIEELTNANKGLQDTIVNQSGKIANLEKNSEEQAQKMTELEDKLNKVFGIVKDEIDE